MAAKKGKKSKKSKLESKLVMKKVWSWDKLTEKKKKTIYNFCEGYKDFLAAAKSEREAVFVLQEYLENKGYQSIDKVEKVRAGTKLYIINRNKSMIIARFGKEPLEKGLNIITSHIDAPRLDLKQHPLYEDGETKLALLKTHYYGGIKKYQWVNTPLAIHGNVVKSNGKVVDIKIGDDPNDPVFVITDLLPHLYRRRQGKRRLSDGIKGEELNVLVGSQPVREKAAKQKVKLWVLDYLNKKYGMIEEDFVSADLEIVPAEVPRDIGFDKSMIGAYGQDDRICVYTSIRAIVDMPAPKRTAVCVLYDREEIGSEGFSSARSKFFENGIGNLIGLKNPDYRDSYLRKVLESSRALSSDVNAGINPIFPDVHEKRNAAKMGYGIVITKFTGSGGKYGASEASAEFVGEIRNLLNKNKIPWQSAELGKVDEGGGGTVAKHIARYNMDVLDCGPPVLSMHSPFEISSKLDVHSTYQAYVAFYRS